MQKTIGGLLFLLIARLASAQPADTLRGSGFVAADSSEVVVHAFYNNLNWKAAPAAVAVIGAKAMDRYSGSSLVPVLNTVPGVRMEERSPGSYRLSFRGSLLRSPFGVRNVKVYWNDIPLTDAGGNTYLNLIDLGELSGAELIKGPAASVYGANTGGALLLRSALPSGQPGADHFNINLSGGSYGLLQEQTAWQHSSQHFSSALQQVHQQSDGYRQQSATRKDLVKWQGGWAGKTQRLLWILFYTDLYYQTPGGITLAQMQADPTLARQPAGAIPGSVQQQASVYNKTIFSGIHHEAKLDDRWALQSFITANHTDFTNPFITNYEKRNERNLGAGTRLQYRSDRWQWITGLEWLYDHSNIDDYGNRGGKQDTVQFKDDIYAKQWFVFSQLQFQPSASWTVTAGMSLNNQSYRYKRLSDPAAVYTTRSIEAVFTPRIAVLYRLNRNISAYAVAAKGFSPPALAEVRPSDGNFYGDLNAESGWNFEAGIKGELAENRLQFDLAFYSFKLEHAIVRRNNALGAEYFVNAGSTSQQGIELMTKLQVFGSPGKPVTGFWLWSSFSFQPYRFSEYQQGAAVYSGHALTGVPRTMWVSGADLEMHRFFFNISVNATSSLPLTDDNDVYADAYQLVQCKAGLKMRHLQLFAGMDNLLNQVYSLGNDINAAGKRYYNPAAGRSVFGGIRLDF
ncbi:MAG: TonB-dependent receptor [Chitinophagaceae bacterium]|nr:TonB-dependent receptor [Chitinophagaceae bacterium]